MRNGTGRSNRAGEPSGGVAIRGTLHFTPTGGQPFVDAVEFSSLQELLDLCEAHAPTAAFARVELHGASAGEPRRLVLDFGQFSPCPA